ncbi:X-ray radiation resistance-associated protein 1 isoform X3 [Pseudoliparis swirei]|uniref:X-ray radiation resistance-associated protein 1 isoform X3 n=1 Tax=Pseudoliparis swirei TaxID=2059687 RepID=UPI0024BEA49E|nr:X-ray radiation resistance-associated protein 1 isoform X3 [Pseudoliparis swirei]
MSLENEMAEASYKLDEGQSSPTKCFPRTLNRRRRKEGAGHWLVAYRKSEEQRYRNVQRSLKETYKEHENDSPHGNTLDGLFLLQLHCVDEPSELCSVDISEQKLNNVKPEELQVFGNVAYIDASVNSLSLGSFSSFVSLRELNLSLNGLCDMTCHAADFPHLQVLDLSYNSSSADDIISIGHLPRLKVLHLTGNQLHHLPHLGSFIHDPTQQRAEEDESDFKALEVLILDDNKLTSGVFNSLANLQRLKYLNLQGNLISEIPYLQLAVEEREEDEEGGGGGGGIAHTQTTPSAIEDFKKISQERRKRSSLPLPELQFLDLSDNKLAEEEALMAAALFPKLREMDIHSNPLTTQRSGDPPLLTHYLHLRLGVTIKRKKSREAAKFPPKASAHPKWKVEGRTPKMALTDATCSAQRSESEVDDDDREDPEHFFVTQATDVPGCEFVLPDDEKRAAAAGSRETSPDAQWSPDVPVEPGGIQTAVRMLEHALKNLNVLRDPKPGVDRIQMRRRERRMKVKQPAERRVNEMIRQIKESTTVTDVPLSRAIRGSGVDERERREALALLRDLKAKHKTAHRKTMERAARLESGAEPPAGGTPLGDPPSGSESTAETSRTGVDRN